MGAAFYLFGVGEWPEAKWGPTPGTGFMALVDFGLSVIVVAMIGALLTFLVMLGLAWAEEPRRPPPT